MLDFEILYNDLFLNFVPNKIDDAINKFVLGITNDFEDGEWRYSKFQNFIWDNIAETCLSQQERNALIYRPQTILFEAAKNLRLTESDDDVGRGSELAEIVLYGIMKHHFGALSVVPKIFYKQNNQDNAKGADSIHILVDENDFSLWFGEAKFYKNIENSYILKTVNSVINSLETGKLKKENSIITNVSDLDCLEINKSLRNEIKSLLSTRNSIDNMKSKLNIPILLLHECTITKDTSCIDDNYRYSIIEFQKERIISYFEKQLSRKEEVKYYERIKFHLILFPVPDKEEIVNKFITNVQHQRNQ